MFSILVRLSSIQICTLYTYLKVLNIKHNNIAIETFALATTIVLTYYIGSLYTALMIPFMIYITVCYLILSKNGSLLVKTTAAIISYGISFFVFTAANVASSIMRLFFSGMSVEIFSIIIMIIQLLVIFLLFKIKRLKKGMPFLKNIAGTTSGLIISAILLNSITILINNDDAYIYALPFLSVLLFGGVIYTWWRIKLTQLYISNTKDAEIKNLKENMEEKERRILYLEQQNSELAKVIHTDNKLVSALKFAVNSSLDVLNNEADLETIHSKGRELLTLVEEISHERFGIINTHQLLNKDLPKTKVTLLDVLFNYMLNKASIDGITFDVNLMGSIKYMVENIITDKDLAILLAELIDNALIAVKKSDIKKVLVTLGVVESNYTVYIFDSGEPFTPEVLSEFGKNQITTHQNEGGSGIGLMTVNEIVSKYNAQIDIITLPPNNVYTKQIAIKFVG